MTTAAIIVAAGRGTRAGEGEPKQWRQLRGRTVLEHTVDAFRSLGRIVLVIHPEDMERALHLFGGTVTMVEGGADRTGSVRNALEALAGSEVMRVLIHDGARPLVRPDLIARVLEALERNPAAAPALAVTDALWRGTASGPKGHRVAGTQSREGLFRAQTPQGFRFDAILGAHRAFPESAADDVEIARKAGLDVAIVAGDEDNLKITYAQDFQRAERILRTDMDVRLGNGYDVHAFCEGESVILCGVEIPHDKALLGHSDADVGMHALTDAIYGAMAEGDIGRHFPPSDPQWKGAPSDIFLRHAADLARERGFRIANADVTLICERPKVGPHAAKMMEALAAIMGVDPARVSVKATTSEKLGFTGREEGIAAIATATLIAD
ncbi:bifunctional 2-C-methyl-D-erythritol 4-phosphate cytidylyltransferase/2-C-methyl-D-erythritol 2,4-cyclodiphosphate synthase [Phaeovulum vinaykumarii]|uniref:Bifunctional enzyme IspD/IspF n=1 Tax=Phaeovulum vinaykumarii TaxID=407234 RepID=A0A1N7LM45_9RHOB|nr:bifunctional 2-C-methyl-D-erythritol 4-phosphate cytidylyltransferase/2-C-methyl-D-erythritol 2,4-cyclodiphosphate synthase [Phaeovulum vinaykumarii]SIS74923.1 2-C-methyl-D-erythritol 2,4-cyclodiphosphate synthase [Phaeovulum vinaykumarii]SOC05357.1 2-C-methyl-D-erythritol 2,4-cyclodiphosphate synthase [Phaeovulum vinaykumarii]